MIKKHSLIENSAVWGEYETVSGDMRDFVAIVPKFKNDIMLLFKQRSVYPLVLDSSWLVCYEHVLNSVFGVGKYKICGTDIEECLPPREGFGITIDVQLPHHKQCRILHEGQSD